MQVKWHDLQYDQCQSPLHHDEAVAYMQLAGTRLPLHLPACTPLSNGLFGGIYKLDR